jgi:hypothetical protein
MQKYMKWMLQSKCGEVEKQARAPASKHHPGKSEEYDFNL